MFDQAAIDEISRIAVDLGVEPAALLAVAKVESGGRAFANVNGVPMPLIRWEGHYYYKHLPENLRRKAMRAGLAAPNFGVIKNPKTQTARYNLLARASKIDAAAALKSCSWGLGQVMGANAEWIGYADVFALVADAKDFLGGKSDALRKRLQAEMTTASEALDFETAARLRDRIRALAPITTSQGINPRGIEEADVVGVHQDGGQTCVHVVFIRAGQNWGDRSYYPRHDKDAGAAKVLTAFIGQFYDDKPAAKLILTSIAPENAELLAEALSMKAERRIEIHAPQRGEKTRLVEHARRNAEEALARKLAESASQARLLSGVAEAFNLDAPPKRIEVYDNSHIQGAKAVGAMIVTGPDGFEKSQYRTWNIKSEDLTPGDDYGMMREVMQRRFARLLKDTEGDKRPDTWPDLVLIDGGRGQLSATLEALADINLGPDDVNLIAIAKGPNRDAGRETFFRPRGAPFKLEPRSPVLYFLQRLRDEAHRFAIGTHRAKRKSDITKNPLDDIPGVGGARKKALLSHFGSARAVSRAALSDLEAVDGISKQMARKVFDWFQDGG